MPTLKDFIIVMVGAIILGKLMGIIATSIHGLW